MSNDLNAEQKMILRDALVAVAVCGMPHGLLLGAFANGALLAGFRLDADTLLMHLCYLEAKGLLVKEDDRLSAGVKRWKATAAAVEHYESQL